MPAFTLRHDIPPVELAPGVAMKFKVIPPVDVQQAALATDQPLSFMMGSRDGNADERPRHRVIIPQPFYLGEFPVTQQEFACFRKDHQNGFAGKPNHPVENVSWHDAQEFLRWMKETTNLPEEAVIRLPCEAEWEYACRAGTDTDYAKGDGEAGIDDAGWFDGNAGGTTHPVGTKKPNSWGLYHMHGNVWEWCEDVYDPKAYAKREHPWSTKAWTEEDSGSDVIRTDGTPGRVVRGGSWDDSAEWCRAAFRFGGRPGFRNGSLGFRVFLALPGPAGPEDQSGGGAGLPQSEEANT
jgi:formylglycine-generating enzyme required for sulfatase activity